MANIPEKTKFLLWGMAGGRCSYCNRALYYDDLTKTEFNTAYIAHIIAEKPNGPRGDTVESERLKTDLSNLMLMCDTHHRLIDLEDVEGHPVELLRKMKFDHEKKIALQTEAAIHRESHILLFGSKIGDNTSPLSWSNACEAMTPSRYPAERTALEIGIRNSALSDHDFEYWNTERQNLKKNFDRIVRQSVESGHISHLSVFAIAPQPLLIELGLQISDLLPAEIYQLHREPTTWRWQEQESVDFEIRPPKHTNTSNLALVISLSADVDPKRILESLGGDTAIWTLTTKNPNNDLLRSPGSLSSFRRIVRKLFNEIKLTHGQNAVLNVFPAMPVSCAVEFGRVYQPKADLPMTIYDQNRKRNGFIKAFDMNH